MPTGLQQRKRDLVREAIAHAAWELFAAEGYEATTVTAIARAAGVSRRTFFRYFSSKEDVVVGTSDALAEDVLAAFARRPAAEPPLVALHRALRPVVEARLADADEARAIVRLLRESRTLRRAMLERHARMEERLARLMARRLGTDPRKDPTPALLAFVARALLDTAFNVWYDQRPRKVGAMIDDLFRRLRSVAAAGSLLLIAALGTLPGCGSSGPSGPSPGSSPTVAPTPSPAPTLTPVPAPVSARAIPMYESIPAPVSKAYLELAGGDHLCVETGNGDKAVQGKYVVAWAKRFVDGDVRYSPYLCGAPHEADLRGDAVSAYRENCPY